MKGHGGLIVGLRASCRLREEASGYIVRKGRGAVFEDAREIGPSPLWKLRCSSKANIVGVEIKVHPLSQAQVTFIGIILEIAPE